MPNGRLSRAFDFADRLGGRLYNLYVAAICGLATVMFLGFALISWLSGGKLLATVELVAALGMGLLAVRYLRRPERLSDLDHI